MAIMTSTEDNEEFTQASTAGDEEVTHYTGEEPVVPAVQSLRIRAVGHRSGVVCARETFCTEYSVLLNLTLSSDRADVPIHLCDAHAGCHLCKQTGGLDDAVSTVRRIYREVDPSISENTIVDLVVSCDGSWMTQVCLWHWLFR